jgi:7,8-dihydropterin-6-yl-methyl-4-(beta-D-ribofuranosyl)aminobenzene 5'-phosphate synthase
VQPQRQAGARLSFNVRPHDEVTMRNLCMAIIVLVTCLPLAAQAEETPNQITVLVDAFSDRSDLKKDWGYSAVVEYSGRRILFDTGNDSELFRFNVDVLGIDFRNLDAVVISHRHGDHTDVTCRVSSDHSDLEDGPRL